MFNSMTGPLRGILFDKDGTLLDLEVLWMPAAEQTIDEALQRHCGGSVSFRGELLLSVGISEGRALPESPLVAGTNEDVALAIRAVLTRHGVSTEDGFVGETADFLTRCACGETANVRPTCPGLAKFYKSCAAAALCWGLPPQTARKALFGICKSLGSGRNLSFSVQTTERVAQSPRRI